MNDLQGRILVTGAKGFLGTHLVRTLLDSPIYRAAANEGVIESILTPHHQDLELLTQSDVYDYFSDHRPNVVFHLAAHVGGIGANRRRPGAFFFDNMLMGMNVIDACRAFGVAKVIVVGTVCSYPQVPPRIPFQEEDLWEGYPEPTNAPYGIAKKSLLVMGWAYREEYGLPIIHVIPTNLYGPGDNFDDETSHVIPALIKKILAAKEAGRDHIVGWGDGTPTREFLYAEDCAQGLLMAGDHYTDPMPMNLGSDQEIPIRGLAALISDIVGWQGKILWDKEMPNGQPRRAVDSSLARSLGWSARTPLHEGLKATIDWYRGER